jgi:hypothetical protein
MRLNIIFILTFFITTTLYLTGCDILNSNSGNFNQLLIETDQKQYSITEDQDIDVDIINESQRSIFRLSHGHVTLEKKLNDNWENLGQWYLTIAIPPSLVEIKSGEDFSPAAPRLTTSSPIIKDTGLYRFNFALYSSKPTSSIEDSVTERLLPLENRVSNTFQIVD